MNPNAGDGQNRLAAQAYPLPLTHKNAGIAAMSDHHTWHCKGSGHAMLARHGLPRLSTLLALLCALVLAGCASTAGSPDRLAGLGRLVLAPTPAIVSYPRRLTVDQSLIVLHRGEVAAPLNSVFDSAHQVLALLGGIRDAAPSLNHGVAELVDPATSDATDQIAETPVLFVWPTWQVSYQRLPPRLDRVRLELGVIAKVIPRTQVMQGRGNLALRTAAWEARCHLYAADGAYLSVSEWLDDDAAQWRQALAEVREVCSRIIGEAFEQGLAAARQDR